jgi:hypothetical protein
MFSLLGVNSVVSIKSLFKVINHTLQGSVFTLISTFLLPLPDCQTDTEWEGTPHFAAGLHLSSHFHTLSYSTILLYFSLNLRDTVSP